MRSLIEQTVDQPLRRASTRWIRRLVRRNGAEHSVDELESRLHQRLVPQRDSKDTVEAAYRLSGRKPLESSPLAAADEDNCTERAVPFAGRKSVSRPRCPPNRERPRRLRDEHHAIIAQDRDVGVSFE